MNETKSKVTHNVVKDQLEKGVSFMDILKGDLDNLKVGLWCR